MTESRSTRIVRTDASPPSSAPPPARRRPVDRALRRARWVADFLDQRFRLPGTQIRFGYDAIIGLLPGVGDTITAVIGLSIVAEAVRQKVGNAVVAKMLMNIAVDWFIGLVPIIDLFLDVAFKAHLRNARLLERELAERVAVAAEQPGEAERGRAGAE